MDEQRPQSQFTIFKNACFDQWFVLRVEGLSRVHPIFCLFLFLFFFAINVEVSKPQNN